MKSWTLLCALLPLIAGSKSSANGPAPATQPATLSQSVGQMRACGTALADLIDQLGQATGQRILVNWSVLSGVHVTKDLPVTTDLSNLRFDEALTRLLDAVGGTHTRLGYSVDNGVVEITTSEELSKNVVTEVYDMRALIKNPLKSKEELAVISRQVCGIDPLSWRDAGGLGCIDESDRQLIITQTPEVQSRIAAHLRQQLPGPKIEQER
jgi:hypothetical protein